MKAEEPVDRHVEHRVLGGKRVLPVKNQPPTQPNKLCCPQCGCDRLFRAGIRYLQNNQQLQRWLCRECNHRFTQKPKTEKQKIIPVLEKHLKTPHNGSSKCQDRDEFYSGRARYLRAEGNINLVKVDPEQINAQREGIQTQQTDNQSRIVNFLWNLKQDGAKDNTIRTYNGYLQKLAKHTDLTPDSVKEYLAKTTEWTIATKQTVTVTYNSFLAFHGLTWNPPRYKAPDKIQYIPPETDIDTLISGAGKVLSAFLPLQRAQK